MNPEQSLPTPEATLRRDHIASMLSEEGPYSVSNGFLSGYRDADPSLRNRFKADLALVTNLLGAQSLTQAKEALDSGGAETTEKHRINKRALSIYFPKKDVDSWKEAGRQKKIEQYSSIADAFINSYMRTGVWEPFSQITDLSEEVQSTKTIPGLFAIVFSDQYDPKVRFEAKRKLVLMSLAAALDVRSNELAEQDRYPEFTKFLNDFIWHKEPEGTGATRAIDVLSRHSYDSFEVQGAPEELTTTEQREQARRRIAHQHPKKGGYVLRLSSFNQRHINHKGELIPVYQDSRQKNLLSRMAKMIRKGEEDPSVAVQDTTGLLMVVRDQADAYKLLRHIASGGNSRSSLIKIEDLEDTLDGGEYSAKSSGSSPKVKQLKFIARQAGMSMEMIIHTYQTYLDYQYKDGVAHEEYQVKRMLESGAFGLLFPDNLYHIPNDELNRTIEHQRRVRRIPRT